MENVNLKPKYFQFRVPSSQTESKPQSYFDDGLMWFLTTPGELFSDQFIYLRNKNIIKSSSVVCLCVCVRECLVDVIKVFVTTFYSTQDIFYHRIIFDSFRQMKRWCGSASRLFCRLSVIISDGRLGIFYQFSDQGRASIVCLVKVCLFFVWKWIFIKQNCSFFWAQCVKV